MLGPVFLSGIYILACVLALPGSIFTLAAGFLFGLGVGYASVAVGSVLGAASAFWIGRTVGRDWVRRKVEGNARFLAVDHAVAREGFKIVLLTRLSPAFPFNLQNFAYGITGVSFSNYFWATLIGMAPGTVMLVYVGSAMKSLAEILSGKVETGTAQQVVFGVGLAATILVTLLVTRIAKNALNKTV
ncbi:TVP38/TMEM64 family protein [bacterium]|nr:TVP38/TMEM64 family protein [bacterium]